MLTFDLQQLAENPANFTPEQLTALQQEYPYFVWPALLLLESGSLDGARARDARTRIALAVGDRDALTRVLDPDSDFSDFYSDMQPVQLSTDDTIDAFLSHFGSDTDKETDLLTRMIFDPAAYREQEIGSSEQETGYREQEIEAQQQAVAEKEEESKAEEEVAATGDGSTQVPSQLSLSLARMMIRNRNYTKALEILERLNFDNSEKSIIFADQIRFLKKLIIIQNHSNQ